MDLGARIGQVAAKEALERDRPRGVRVQGLRAKPEARGTSGRFCPVFERENLISSSAGSSVHPPFWVRSMSSSSVAAPPEPRPGSPPPDRAKTLVVEALSGLAVWHPGAITKYYWGTA